jgi:hypothetical protein
MARRNLAYYGGQYDPSDYYQDVQPAGVISMYNPQSQAQFIDAVAKRQERFDAGKLSQAQEIARIAETETYDMAELTKRLKSFEDTVNSTVKDKYNGDYSAAANEIAKMIGTERTNPFYHFNKQKVEMGKAYLDAKMKLGANFMSSGNPFDVSFQDWQQGKTFEFTPINSADITQRSASLFKNFANKLMGDSGLMNSPEGQYFRTVQQYGFQSPEEAMAYAEKTGLLDQLYESMPELAGVENQEAVMNAIYQGASYGVGTTKVDYLANRGFDDGSGKNKSLAGGNFISPAGLTELPTSQQKMMKDEMWSGFRDNAVQEVTGGKYKTYDEVKDIRGREGRLLRRDIQTEIKNQTSEKATMVYNFNPMAQMGTEGWNTYQNLAKAANAFLNEGVVNGDVIGATKQDSKALENLSDRTLKGYSFVKSYNPEMPYYLNLHITGVPPSKGAKKADPIEVNTFLNPESFFDNINFLQGINQLDPKIGHTIISGYINNGNVEMAKRIAPIFGIDPDSI